MTLRKLVLSLLAAVAVYYALFGGEYSWLELRHIEREREREAARLDATQQESARLRARADSLAGDPAALERIARERYGMIGEGERLYRFADTTAAAADSGSD